MTIQALVLSGDGVEQRAIVSRDGVERERERERERARETLRSLLLPLVVRR
jgi:hypothetical protein